jgi:molecular chaperone GrpE
MTEKDTQEEQVKEPEKVKQPKKSSSGKNEGKEEMVTIPLKSMEEQLKEIDDLKEKANTYSEGWKRERADFDNYRKRVQRDQEQEKQNRMIDIIKKYLVLHDDLGLAMKNAPSGQENQQWLDGIALIFKKMENILENEGIEQINTEKVDFDPNLHEAISHEENPDFQSGQIIEVVKPGYKIKNRIIRPALVRVAK